MQINKLETVDGTTSNFTTNVIHSKDGINYIYICCCNFLSSPPPFPVRSTPPIVSHDAHREIKKEATQNIFASLLGWKRNQWSTITRGWQQTCLMHERFTPANVCWRTCAAALFQQNFHAELMLGRIKLSSPWLKGGHLVTVWSDYRAVWSDWCAVLVCVCVRMCI